MALNTGYVLFNSPIVHAKLLKGEYRKWIANDPGSPFCLHWQSSACWLLMPAGLGMVGKLTWTAFLPLPCASAVSAPMVRDSVRIDRSMATGSQRSVISIGAVSMDKSNGPLVSVGVCASRPDGTFAEGPPCQSNATNLEITVSKTVAERRDEKDNQGAAARDNNSADLSQRKHRRRSEP